MIRGCDKTPCKVKKGSDLSVEINFTTSDLTSILEPRVSGKVLGMKIPLSIPKDHQNACEHLKNLKCPLDANVDVTYFVEMPILKSYPSMKTEIEFNLVGDNQKSVVCFKIDGQIIS